MKYLESLRFQVITDNTVTHPKSAGVTLKESQIVKLPTPGKTRFFKHSLANPLPVIVGTIIRTLAHFK